MRTIKFGNLTEQEAAVLLQAVEKLRRSMTSTTPGARTAEKLQLRIGKLILMGGKNKNEKNMMD